MAFVSAAAPADYQTTFSPRAIDELGPGETDFCSRDGALALKAKIESYWRDRGQEVFISMQNVGFHPAIRAARYDVRSDMVNGLPRPSKG
ncbi:MAG: hypothetical protein ABW199_12540 [Caulobacterales bacterium]